MRYIFDLDHTVIDSSHRQLTKADGSLDLAHWIANNTRAKIMADSLLPLATQGRKAYAKGGEIVVCTARVIGQDDRDFLAMNGLRYHAMLSRPLGATTSDDLLKLVALRKYAQKIGRSWANFCATSIMWDDNENVQKTLASRGLIVHNAIIANKELTA